MNNMKKSSLTTSVKFHFHSFKLKFKKKISQTINLFMISTSQQVNQGVTLRLNMLDLKYLGLMSVVKLYVTSYDKLMKYNII